MDENQYQFFSMTRPRPLHKLVPWDQARDGSSFSFSKDELGLDGVQYLVNDARKNGVVLDVTRYATHVVFFVDRNNFHSTEHVLITEYLASRGNTATVAEILAANVISKSRVRKVLNDLFQSGKVSIEDMYQPKRGRPTKMVQLLNNT